MVWASLIGALTALTPGALAADRLPLQPGPYVRAGVACENASNADTLSYWGGNSGINGQQTRCTLQRFSRRGAVYQLKQTCEAIRFGDRFSHSTDVEVLSTTSFKAGGETYRRCGDRIEF